MSNWIKLNHVMSKQRLSIIRNYQPLDALCGSIKSNLIATDLCAYIFRMFEFWCFRIVLTKLCIVVTFSTIAKYYKYLKTKLSIFVVGTTIIFIVASIILIVIKIILIIALTTIIKASIILIVSLTKFYLIPFL